MPSDTIADQCTDPTQELSIKIPCRLAERVDVYKAIYTAVSEIKVRVNQHFSSQLLDGRTAGQITYNSGSIDTNLGEDFLVSTWNETTNHISVDITYYPDPDDHTKSPMTRTESIEKPKIE